VLARFFQLYFVFTVVCGLNPSWHFTVQYSIVKSFVTCTWSARETNMRCRAVTREGGRWRSGSKRRHRKIICLKVSLKRGK